MRRRRSMENNPVFELPRFERHDKKQPKEPPPPKRPEEPLPWNEGEDEDPQPPFLPAA